MKDFLKETTLQRHSELRCQERNEECHVNDFTTYLSLDYTIYYWYFQRDTSVSQPCHIVTEV